MEEVRKVMALPLRYEGKCFNDHGGSYLEISDANGNSVIGEFGPISPEHAEVIVRAVNAHDDLVKALQELLRECKMHTGWPANLSTYENARAALAMPAAPDLAQTMQTILKTAEESEFKAISLLKLREIMEKAGVK